MPYRLFTCVSSLLGESKATAAENSDTPDGMMAPKATLPLYQAGKKSRPRFSSRRKYSGAKSSRQGGRVCCVGWCFWAAVISPLVLLVVSVGILIGVELSQVPPDGGVIVDNGDGIKIALCPWGVGVGCWLCWFGCACVLFGLLLLFIWIADEKERTFEPLNLGFHIYL